MDRWRVSDGREQASELALSFYDRIEASLSRYTEQRPEIVEISFNTSGTAPHICCLKIQLFPGCDVEIASGYTENVFDFVKHGRFEENDASANIIAWINRFRQVGYDHLDDLLHDLRRRIRRKTVDWRARGLHAVFSGLFIEVNADDLWLGFMPIRIDIFRDRFGPKPLYLDGNYPDDFDEDIDGFEKTLRRHIEERSFFDTLGADGFVSQIALNVLRHHGDLRSDIRAIHNGNSVNKGHIRIYEDRSEICAEGYIEGDRYIDIGPHFIWIENLEIPDIIRLNCVGQPITKLISMPYLSDSMRIVSFQKEYGGRYFQDGVRINFDQPEFLFCGHSGRYWPVPED